MKFKDILALCIAASVTNCIPQSSPAETWNKAVARKPVPLEKNISMGIKENPVAWVRFKEYQDEWFGKYTKEYVEKHGFSSLITSSWGCTIHSSALNANKDVILRLKYVQDDSGTFLVEDHKVDYVPFKPPYPTKKLGNLLTICQAPLGYAGGYDWVDGFFRLFSE